MADGSEKRIKTKPRSFCKIVTEGVLDMEKYEAAFRLSYSCAQSKVAMRINAVNTINMVRAHTAFSFTRRIILYGREQMEQSVESARRVYSQAPPTSLVHASLIRVILISAKLLADSTSTRVHGSE